MGARAKLKKRTAEATSAPPLAESKLKQFGQTPWAYAVVSLAVLIPCFWQSHIQAGDLGSHIYNAWLAELIGKGQAPGLVVTSQTTNVLFDLILSGLLRLFGAAAAQRVGVSLAVLIFFWGAFAFISVVSRRAWPVAPVLAVFAYGWVFHIGFFNFYLSLGLCCWALALLWRGPGRLWPAAIPLAALAYMAHGLALVWAAAVLIYAWIWQRLTPRARLYQLGASLASIVLLRAAIMSRFTTRWFTAQIWNIFGADQLWVYGSKYNWLIGALVAVWIWVAAARRRDAPAASAPAGALGAIALLTAAGIFLIPTAIWLPRYNHQLAFIADRMSLPLAVVICGLVSLWMADGRLGTLQAASLGLVSLLFFGFLYADETVLNNFEDRLDSVVSQLPPGQRVVLSAVDYSIQVNALTHMIDRACIGHCWSYANYEPSSAQFRIRVKGETSLVVSTENDSMSLEAGSYVVKPRDLPLFQIQTDPTGRLIVRQPPAGSPIGTSPWSGL